MNELKKPWRIDLPNKDTIKQILEALIILLVISDTILIGFILVYPSYSNSIYIIGFDLIVCVILFIELILKKNEESNLRYIRNNWKDILAMIPLLFFTLLPAGWTSYLAFIRLFKIVVLLEKGKKNIFNFVQKTKPSYVLLTFLIIICVGSIAILMLENSPFDEINTPIDALWYVMATMSTVGYGDIIPESFGGKLLGIILMIVGVGFFSLLTASLSSWLMKEDEMEEEELKNKLTNMEKSINEMKSEMKELKELLKENK